ncbi:ABC transporter permease [Clostridiisalibacter paucivorans]|uniref:ABC transporter permease n=1 Tax=Clostridiisalibacter paucivorans TaxID=408753 RepID=UPI000478BBFF|nr:ABC transporter permease [Clostridiisalibacter paucivorans]
MHSNSKEISKEIIAGRAIREDTNVAVIPKYFYPDYFNETKFLKDDIEYLNGENYIDKTITVEYYSYDYMDTTFKINRTYNYTFKVIGVYDNVNTLNESYDIYIPYKDMKKIQTNIEQNSNEQTESKQIYALVDNYAHMDTVIEDLKNNNVYFKRQAKVGYIGELARYIYVLGNLLSIFVFGIGGSYIMITTIKAIKNCTMEIGLLKSMGYTNNIIRNIIITNATITRLLSSNSWQLFFFRFNHPITIDF